MKSSLAGLLLILCACASWGAQAADPAQPDAALVAQSMADFDRNVALGAPLTIRPGTPAELDQLRILSQRGLDAARKAVEQRSDSAEAQYALGSWILYGYRVVQVDRLSFDPQGRVMTLTAQEVIQGPSGSPEEGLSALKRSVELAPENKDYLVDYAAALADYDRATEATGILKGIWNAAEGYSRDQKLRAGLLLSVISEGSGDLQGAREWIYMALSLDPLAGEAVEQLRYLDRLQVAENQAAIESVREFYEQPSLEGVPEEEEAFEAEPQSGAEESAAEAEDWSEFDTGNEEGVEEGNL